MVDNQKVAEALRQVQARDRQLGQELDRRLIAASNETVFTGDRDADPTLGLTPETIVLRTGRPVLAIRQNEVDIQIDDPDSRFGASAWRTPGAS